MPKWLRNSLVGATAATLTSPFLAACSTPVKATPGEVSTGPIAVETASSNPPTPGETGKSPDTEYRPTSIEPGLSHEDFTKALEERYNAWANASSHPSLQEEYKKLSSEGTSQEEWTALLHKRAEKDSEPYIKALYVDGWQDHKRLPEDVAHHEKITFDSAEKYIYSTRENSYDLPFERTITYTFDPSKTENMEGGGRRIYVTVETTDTKGNVYTTLAGTITTIVDGGGERILDVLLLRKGESTE